MGARISLRGQQGTGQQYEQHDQGVDGPGLEDFLCAVSVFGGRCVCTGVPCRGGGPGCGPSRMMTAMAAAEPRMAGVSGPIYLAARYWTAKDTAPMTVPMRMLRGRAFFPGTVSWAMTIGTNIMVTASWATTAGATFITSSEVSCARTMTGTPTARKPWARCWR